MKKNISKKIYKKYKNTPPPHSLSHSSHSKFPHRLCVCGTLPLHASSTQVHITSVFSNENLIHIHTQSNPRKPPSGRATMTTSVSAVQKDLDLLDTRYILEKVIGAGSYGMVLRATDKLAVQDEPVKCAVKKVSKEIFTDMNLAKRILREIKLLAHFNNDNVVGLRNIMTPQTKDFKEFFIVMDLMETDLKTVFKSGQKMTNAHVQYFLYQILRALKFIHSAGVIHRDITPANILVNINCDLKICDFGLARDEPTKDDQFLTDYVTMRWYRAPELVMESILYNGAVDVWGVGCILCEMLGSKPLFNGKDRVNQLDKIIDIIGTPSDAEITTIGSKAAQNYIRKKSQKKRLDFAATFPSADPQVHHTTPHHTTPHHTTPHMTGYRLG